MAAAKLDIECLKRELNNNIVLDKELLVENAALLAKCKKIVSSLSKHSKYL